MNIAEYSQQRRKKGMEDFMGVMKTGAKAGVSIARAVAGDWIGAAGMWAPEIVGLAKNAGEAMGMFEKWKAGRQ
jgi:hypothetical protein